MIHVYNEALIYYIGLLNG